MMIEASAVAEAAKRNKHKGKALWNKEWIAIASPEGPGWTVALVDSAALKLRRAAEARGESHMSRLRAIGALMRNDWDGFTKHADDALQAELKSLAAQS